MLSYKIKETYRFGPRKVSKIGKQAAIYLPKELRFLKGKLVQVTIEVLDIDGGVGDVGENG